MTSTKIHRRDRIIDDFMTRGPLCIEAGQPAADARLWMRQSGCRHLPVQRDGKLVGIVSERSLLRLETLVALDRAKALVVDAMDAAYVVAPGTPLLQVAAEMAGRKAGAAVIARGGEVFGIFTSTDALDELVVLDSELLVQRTQVFSMKERLSNEGARLSRTR